MSVFIELKKVRFLPMENMVKFFDDNTFSSLFDIELNIDENDVVCNIVLKG